MSAITNHRSYTLKHQYTYILYARNHLFVPPFCLTLYSRKYNLIIIIKVSQGRMYGFFFNEKGLSVIKDCGYYMFITKIPEHSND